MDSCLSGCAQFVRGVAAHSDISSTLSGGRALTAFIIRRKPGQNSAPLTHDGLTVGRGPISQRSARRTRNMTPRRRENAPERRPCETACPIHAALLSSAIVSHPGRELTTPRKSDSVLPKENCHTKNPQHSGGLPGGDSESLGRRRGQHLGRGSRIPTSDHAAGRYMTGRLQVGNLRQNTTITPSIDSREPEQAHHA